METKTSNESKSRTQCYIGTITFYGETFYKRLQVNGMFIEIFNIVWFSVSNQMVRLLKSNFCSICQDRLHYYKLHVGCNIVFNTDHKVCIFGNWFVRFLIGS